MTPEDIVRRAQESLCACEELFAQAGIAPQACLDLVRQHAGAAAARTVERRVADAVRVAREGVEREVQQASAGQPISRRVALRGGV
jgi:hypothetical protein